MQPTTFFRKASVSKMFTAAAIYQLIDEKATLPGSKAPFTLDTLLQDAPPDIVDPPGSCRLAVRVSDRAGTFRG
jgi:hypothetical protein